LATTLSAQLSDELLLFNQFSTIEGLHPLGNDQYLIYGEGTRSRYSYYAKINGKGHVIWEREVVGLRGAFPLKNGRLFFFNYEGRVWTTDHNAEDVQNLPTFLPNDLNTSIWESFSSADYIIVPDRSEHLGQQLHSVSFLDRADGSLISRQETRSILTNGYLFYEQVDESIIEVVSLDFKSLVNTYYLKTGQVKNQRLPRVLSFIEDMTYYDSRLWFSGSFNDQAKVVSIRKDMTSPKVYNIDIPPQYGNSREQWSKIDIQNDQMLLCGESNLLGARSIQNTVFFTQYDIKNEKVIDTLIRPMGYNAYIPFVSFLDNSSWHIAGGYNLSDTWYQPPAFFSQIKFDPVTSSTDLSTTTFSISPNPALSTVVLKGDMGVFPLQLYHSTGHWKQTFSSPGMYSIEHLPAGVFILKSKRKPGFSRKVVKF